MNKKGFTLVELLAVVAILALSVGLIAINYNNLIGKRQDFEDKELAKNVAEAAYAYIDSKKNRNETDSNKKIEPGLCYDLGPLIKSGYLSGDQGLLQQYDYGNVRFSVSKDSDGEKKVKVYKNGVCSGTPLYP